MSILQSLQDTLTRRQSLVEELESIDHELEAIRATLGMASVMADGASLERSLVAILQRDGPTSLQALQREMGLSLHRLHAVIHKADERVEVTGHTNRRRVRLRFDAREVSPYVPPPRGGRALASCTEERTCERPECRKVFKPTGGTSGRFCSRECWGLFNRAAVDAALAIGGKPSPPATDARENASDAAPRTPPEAPSAALLPERRCSACVHKFRPTAAGQYKCPGCEAKTTKKPVVRRGDGPELETVWSGRKEDGPLTTGQGLGSTLAGESRVVR